MYRKGYSTHSSATGIAIGGAESCSAFWGAEDDFIGQSQREISCSPHNKNSVNNRGRAENCRLAHHLGEERLLLHKRPVSCNSEGRKTVFTDNKPGRTWLDGFLKRHPEVKQRKTSVLDEQRAHITEGKIWAWFGEVETSLAEDGVDIRTVIHGTYLTQTRQAFLYIHLGKLFSPMQAISIHTPSGWTTRDRLPFSDCASASGELLPPLIIFPGKRWTFRPEEDFPGAVCKQTDNGWVKSEVFRSWLLETFVPHVQVYYGNFKRMEGRSQLAQNYQQGGQHFPAHFHASIPERLVKVLLLNLIKLCPNPIESGHPGCSSTVAVQPNMELDVSSVLPLAPLDNFYELDLQKEEEEEIVFAPLPDFSLDWFPHFQEAEPLLSPGVAESVDQLIDFIISTGWTSSDIYWVQRRQWANKRRPKEDEHSYRKYLELYNSIVPPPSFDSLPLPDSWTKKLTNVVRKQPPKYISGNSYKAFRRAK
ncbi:tigger transposable element-derived protein 6-like protein [Plakobranchus ocellatus]|uniref:Tigger transposable element-derived protein 6-like protein n=1 Tax=Plakobranchus ocellatus TaxID=259542 RepID=A0AAV3ZD77_9GAST|nr:tigger transposable element-derived protein 6-like protein [Plakobranchus ocellatus]